MIILLTAAGCTLLFSQLQYLKVDGTFTGFFHRSDPAIQIYDEFRNQYGRDDNIIILLQSEDIFDLTFLNTLKKLHQQLEQETPFLIEVNSLINARHTIGADEELIVSDFLEKWPETQEEATKLKAAALASTSYIGIYLSKDAHYAAIHIKNQSFAKTELINEELASGFETTNENHSQPHGLTHLEEAEIRHSIDRTIADYKDTHIEFFIAGGAYTTTALMEEYSNGVIRYTGVALILIAFLLLVIFRKFTMIFLPLTVSFLAMLSALSVMSILEIPVSFSMQIVPSFLIAVGVGNSVHLFTLYYQALNEGRDKQHALCYSLQHSGLAIVMTGLTTAGGLVSFLSSSMKPIAEFGIVTPIGILFTLYFSLVLLPALISIIPATPSTNSVNSNHIQQVIRKLIVALGNFSVDRAPLVVGMWFCMVIISIVMALQINFSFYIYKQLPPDHPVIRALNQIDTKFTGIIPLEIIIDSGTENGVKDPAFLKKIDQLYTLIDTFEYEGEKFSKVVSIVDINKEIHQALNNNNPQFYQIPEDPELVAQELLLFEISDTDELEKVVDYPFRHARVTIAARSLDAVKAKPMMQAFLVEFEKIFAGYSYKKTGILELSVSIFNELYISMASTYIIAFLVITPIMIILMGSLKIGLLSMIPNLAPIIITLGIMGTFGIDLTTATLLVGSIAMGLVVDDTIHFMHNFQRYHLRDGDIKQAVSQTLQSTGMAITFTTLVLSAAFLVFVFNTLIDWIFFGVVASICIVIALFADITLAPALLTLLHKNRKGASSP